VDDLYVGSEAEDNILAQDVAVLDKVVTDDALFDSDVVLESDHMPTSGDLFGKEIKEGIWIGFLN
jgi:hypothetical protein